MKPHLVLVHSFPTNSLLLHGLKQYLDDFFTVHFIDLPGFHINSPPLQGNITLNKFSQYLDQKIAQLHVSEYIVGGVSFGFLVVNNAKLDRRCRAILAMEPFTNVRSLTTSFWQQRFYIALSALIRLGRPFGIERRIWNSSWFNSFIQRHSHYPKSRVDTIIKHIDPHTFFSVVHILMRYRKEPRFHDLPYFLIGNFADRTINFAATAESFFRNVHQLHMVSGPIDHYPTELTKEYFRERIPAEHVARMIGCLRGGE